MTGRPPKGMLVALMRCVLWSSLAALALGGPAGCSSGTETGNPSFQAELSYTGYSSAPLEVGLRSAAAIARIDNAWLDLSDVGLLASGTCSAATPQTVSLPGLGVGDHAAGKHNVTEFELAAASYCALELPFAHAVTRSGDAPSELLDHSLFLQGSLADGTGFSIVSRATPTVRLVADSGMFEIAEKQPRLLIAFDFAQWLAGLDWSRAARTDAGIRIAEDENADLLAQFESNLVAGVALYRDEDGDGQLDVNAIRLAHAP